MDKKRIAAVFLCFVLICPSLCPAWGWGMQKEETFLEWYAEHKDTGGEFTLGGMMRLTSGTKHNPIILDGTGKIKINCGRNEILVACPVVIDNPQLEFVGNGASVFVVNSQEADLRLINGSLSLQGETGILYTNGTLSCEYPQGYQPVGDAGEDRTGNAGAPDASPSDAGLPDTGPLDASPSDAGRSEPSAPDADPPGHDSSASVRSAGEERCFRIEVSANEDYGELVSISGILCEKDMLLQRQLDLDLSHLDIRVSGPESNGISNHSGDVSVSDSHIEAQGWFLAYGIWASGQVDVSGTSVTADGPKGAAVYSQTGTVSCDDTCTLSGPDQPDTFQYVVSGLAENLDAAAVRIHSGPDSLLLPASVEVNLRRSGGTASKTAWIQVESWDLSGVSFDRKGIYSARGILSEESLRAAGAGNAESVVLDQRVNVLDETGTFIDDIWVNQFTNIWDDRTVIGVLCPNPSGAAALYLEYSRDGKSWSAAEWADGQANWLEDYNTTAAYDEFGRLRLIADIPYTNGKIGVRLRTVGGGLYEGTGSASGVDLDTGAVTDVWNPGKAEGDSGGDRGGGTVDPGGDAGKPGDDGVQLQPDGPVGDAGKPGNGGAQPDNPAGDSGFMPPSAEAAAVRTDTLSAFDAYAAGEAASADPKENLPTVSVPKAAAADAETAADAKTAAGQEADGLPGNKTDQESDELPGGETGWKPDGLPGNEAGRESNVLPGEQASQDETGIPASTAASSKAAPSAGSMLAVAAIILLVFSGCIWVMKKWVRKMA